MVQVVIFENQVAKWINLLDTVSLQPNSSTNKYLQVNLSPFSHTSFVDGELLRSVVFDPEQVLQSVSLETIVIPEEPAYH